MVLVPVNVIDHYGKTIDGLGPADFTVYDEQTPQPIASFTREDAPCSVSLVLDISGSMRYALNTAKSVAAGFFKTANPEDEFLLLTVSTLPDSATAFTSDADAVEQQIQSTRPGGMTALLDTVYLGLSRMRKAARPRRAMLILSDGMENQSRYSKGELMQLALEADVQVYTILVDGIPGTSAGAPFVPSMVAKPWQQAAEHQGPLTLEELSKRTGGLYFHVRNEEEGREAAIKAGLALRNEYIIGYRAPTSGQAGKFHKIRVKSNVPQGRVYARNGYYAQ